MTNSSRHVAEVVHFKLNEGATDADCMALLRHIGDWAQAHPGFISRQVSHGDDGSWVDVTVWNTTENAKASQEAFMQQDFAGAMIGMIDKDSFSMIQRPIVWQSA